MVMVLVVLMGLVIGSFISVITYRLPRGEGFVKGRSYCDSCKAELKWIYNIPVFSYLVLKGKSACCGKKISIRYPLIEIASVIGVVFLYPNYIYIILFFLTLAVFVIDLERQIIPDELSLAIFVLALFANLFTGFFCAFLLLLIHLITRGRGMGLGDVKLAIALGTWLGFVNGLWWLTVSFIIGGIAAVILLLLKRANLKTKIAFGPFLIVGFWLVLLYAKIF